MVLAHSSRIYGLDILRAAAITFVMFSHGYVYTESIVGTHSYYRLILDGVGLFFVLSGFLIGSILIKLIMHGDFGPRQLAEFWKRRWLRTLPAYFCVLCVVIVCYYFKKGHQPPSWEKYFLFLQNFNSPHPAFFGEAWSLSVEEWFYLVVPVFMLLVLKLPGEKRWLILGCIISTIAGVTLYREYKIMHHDYLADGTLGSDLLKVVTTRADSIMYGVIGAWLSIYYTSAFYAYKKQCFLLGLFLLIGSNFIQYGFFYLHVRYTLTPLATLLLLPYLSTLRSGSGKIYKVITFISIISYSMYLTNHLIVQRGFMLFAIKWLGLDLEQTPWHNLIALLLFWTITVSASYVLYRVVEKPFMDLRKKSKPPVVLQTDLNAGTV